MAKHKQNQQSAYDYRGEFKGKPGIAAVGKDGKFGYINRQGVEITPLKYDSVGQFEGNN
jgi:hypothetical protein